jgi:tetratricopeptide (TPR) repeat protein
LPDERWQFFALLAVAKGVLEKEDVKALTGMRDRQLRQLHQSWQVTRWMRISEGKLYAFAHPLLATTFAAQLGDEAEDALQDLIDYCAKWEKYQSRYALRHYAEHLREVERWEELYAIARNKDFAVAQQEHLPDEPDLLLKTVQTALLEAADRDDAGAMAEFLLIHAKRILAQESPLDALRSGNLTRALTLSDLYEVERCVLWYLLLAWELKDTGRLEEAQETLERLQIKKLPRFSTNAATLWQGDYAAYLLAYVFDVSEDAYTALVQQLLNDRDRWLLCGILSKHGYFIAALETAQGISSNFERVLQLERIAKAQAEQGQKDAAGSTFAKALEIARTPAPNPFWVHEMGSIAKAQVEELENIAAARNTFVEALETAKKIRNQQDRVRAFIAMAAMQAEVGEFPDALDTISRIDVQGDLEESLRVEVLTVTAEVEAKVGNRDNARVIFTNALKMACGIEDKKKKMDALVKIVRAQAKMREFTDALKTTEELDSPGEKAQALVALATAQTKAGDFTAALASASKIEEQISKTHALVTIAKAQAEAKNFTSALETAEAINDQVLQTDALVAIVKQQAEAADFTTALATKSRIKQQRGQQNALSAIAIAQAKAKNFPIALEIAQQIDSPLMQVETLGFIAKTQAGSRRTQAARATFATALQIAQGAEPAFFQTLALADVAKVQVKLEQKEEGATTASIAHKLAQRIDNPREQAIAMALIAEALTKAGKRKEAQAIFDSAIETAQKIHSQQERVNSFTVIAEAQVRIEEFSIAFETAQRIEWSNYKAQVLAAVAKAQAKAGRGKEAYQTVNNAFEIAQSYYSVWGSIETLCEVAIAQAAVGLKEEALELLTALYETVREDREQDKNLSTIAAAQAEVGEITTAFKITNEIEDEWERLKALRGIACVQWKKGEKEELLSTLAAALRAKDRIEDEQKRVNALRVKAQIQAMVGKGEEAVRTVEAILTERNLYLPRIASWLVETGDRENFKRLLIACAYYLDAAYQMCGYLAQLYSEKAKAVAKVVSKLN